MKHCYLACMAMLFSLAVYAQEADYYKIPTVPKPNSFQQGKTLVSFGYGYLNFMNADYGKMTEGNEELNSIFGAAYEKVEYGCTNRIGVSTNIAFASATAPGAVFSSISLILKPTYHFINTPRWDIYAGIGTGFKMTTVNRQGKTAAYYSNNSRSKQTTPGLDATVGARFMITPNFGIYSEFGAAKSFMQAGITSKF